MPLSNPRDQILFEVQHLGAEDLDGYALHRQSIDLLKAVVGFEGYCSIDMDPGSGLIARVVATDDASRGRYYFEHLYFEHDADNMRRLGRAHPAVHAFSESATHPDARREYMLSVGIAHQLRVGLVSGRELWGMLILFRGHGSPPFARADLELLGRVSPHLGASLRARGLQPHASVDEPMQAPGVLVIDRRGRVVQYSPAAEAWLRDLSDLPKDWREGHNLPSAVALALGNLRPPFKQVGRQAKPIDIRSRTGQWFRLHAGASEGHRQDEVMIVIEALSPRDLAWLRQTTHGLTEQSSRWSTS